MTYTVQKSTGYSGPVGGSFSGKPLAPMNPLVINTAVMQLPIDFAFPGDVEDPRRRALAQPIGDLDGVMAKIFGE